MPSVGKDGGRQGQQALLVGRWRRAASGEGRGDQFLGMAKKKFSFGLIETTLEDTHLTVFCHGSKLEAVWSVICDKAGGQKAGAAHTGALSGFQW